MEASAIAGTLLAAAGILHVLLLRDLRGAREWSLALLVGVVGFVLNLAVALAAGLALWWLPWFIRRARGRTQPL